MSDLDNYLVDKSTTDRVVDFQAGAILLIDKPLEWTSFDVVNKLRSRLRKNLDTKKIKVGHAGTLDPLATGLLIVCTGKMTKQIDQLMLRDKVYTGTIRLGAVTTTYDSEFPPSEYFPIDHITEDLIHSKAKEFVGEIDQMPPIFSALKVDGRTAYSLARQGKTVELKSRQITIFDFKILEIELPDLAFYCQCGKGTYIRSLAHDFGMSLDSGAFLSSLRREAIGEYRVDNAFGIDEALEFIDSQFVES